MTLHTSSAIVTICLAPQRMTCRTNAYAESVGGGNHGFGRSFADFLSATGLRQPETAPIRPGIHPGRLPEELRLDGARLVAGRRYLVAESRNRLDEAISRQRASAPSIRQAEQLTRELTHNTRPIALFNLDTADDNFGSVLQINHGMQDVHGEVLPTGTHVADLLARFGVADLDTLITDLVGGENNTPRIVVGHTATIVDKKGNKKTCDVTARRFGNVGELSLELRPIANAEERERRATIEEIFARINKDEEQACRDLGGHTAQTRWLFERLCQLIQNDARIQNDPELSAAYRLTREDIEHGALAMQVHDNGKLKIPGNILNKPGRLTQEEFALIKGHPREGHDFLLRVQQETKNSLGNILGIAATIALTHHEKWDGSGYPSGLAGRKIPLMGRIAAIVDVFDALSADRGYKKSWPAEKTIAHFESESGKHFDGELVRVLIENQETWCREFEEKQLEWQTRRRVKTTSAGQTLN